MQNKIKITQKEFDDIYDIEQPEITGETEAVEDKISSAPSSIPDKQDTTPLLTEEQLQQEEDFHKDDEIEEILE